MIRSLFIQRASSQRHDSSLFPYAFGLHFCVLLLTAYVYNDASTSAKLLLLNGLNGLKDSITGVLAIATRPMSTTMSNIIPNQLVNLEADFEIFDTSFILYK